MSPAPVFTKHMAHIFSEVERDNERDVFCEEVLNRACRNFGKFSVLNGFIMVTMRKDILKYT